MRTPATMRLLLLLLSTLALSLPASGEPRQPHYDLKTMSPEEVDRAVEGQPRYDFDLAPVDGVIDASGHLIRAADLPAYLKNKAVVRDAFIFLWIQPDSAPLSTIAPTVKPFGDYGLTKIVVRHRPEAVRHNLTTGDERFAAVSKELLAIHQSDQQARQQLSAADQAGGLAAADRMTLVQQMHEADAANLPKVEAILKRYGWLGPADVGAKASGTLFLVIQHADLATQTKYLPLMREAVKAGKARGASLALLEDRIALREGRPQIYGSQLFRMGDGPMIVQPMIDPDHVDERRASVGLPPMADYVKHWNLTWDLEAYKAALPELLKTLPRTHAAPPIPASEAK